MVKTYDGVPLDILPIVRDIHKYVAQNVIIPKFGDVAAGWLQGLYCEVRDNWGNWENPDVKFPDMMSYNRGIQFIWQRVTSVTRNAIVTVALNQTALIVNVSCRANVEFLDKGEIHWFTNDSEIDFNTKGGQVRTWRWLNGFDDALMYCGSSKATNG